MLPVFETSWESESEDWTESENESDFVPDDETSLESDNDFDSVKDSVADTERLRVIELTMEREFVAETKSVTDRENELVVVRDRLTSRDDDCVDDSLMVSELDFEMLCSGDSEDVFERETLPDGLEVVLAVRVISADAL